MIPALGMIRMSADEIRARAEKIIAKLPALNARIEPGESVIGGGSTPEQSIPTFLIVIECPDVNAAERKLRRNDPPGIARIEDDRPGVGLRNGFGREGEEVGRAGQAP